MQVAALANPVGTDSELQTEPAAQAAGPPLHSGKAQQGPPGCPQGWHVAAAAELG